MPRTPRYNVIALTGLVCTAGLGWIAGSWIGAGAAYPAVAAACFAVLFISVVSLAGAHHPHSQFGPANSVTTSRAIATASTAAPVGQAARPPVIWAAIAITVLTGVLDGVGGWLARRTGMPSSFGGRFRSDAET